MSKKTQKFKPYNNVSSNVGNSPVQMLFTSTTTDIKYRNIVDTTATIYREQGLKGFFSGMKMRMVIQSVSSAVAWGTYQALKNTLSNSTVSKH